MMTDQQTCPSNDALITALYGEAAADDLRRLEAHLTACAACRDEWNGLRGVRTVLREWEAPDVPLHFRIIADRDPAADVPVTAARSPLGVYATAGLAAAATLVLGMAAGLANLNVRIDSDGVTFSTGRGGEAAAAARPTTDDRTAVAVAPASATSAGPAPWQTDLVALEQRLRNELATQGPTGRAASGPAQASAPSPAIIQTVQSMIEEAESRQQRALAVRFTEFMRDVDAQRRTDLVSIQNGFGQIEGRTAAEAARSQEMMNYIYRVSTQQPPR